MAGLPSPTGDLSGLVDRLHLVAIHLLRLVRREEEAAGVSTARLSALKAIAEFGPVSVKDLAARERVSSPTMVQVVNDLEQKGLVVRQKGEADRRVTLVRVTEAGRQEFSDERDQVRRAVEGALRGMGKRETVSLNRCVDTLYRAFNPPSQ